VIIVLLYNKKPLAESFGRGNVCKGDDAGKLRDATSSGAYTRVPPADLTATGGLETTATQVTEGRHRIEEGTLLGFGTMIV